MKGKIIIFFIIIEILYGNGLKCGNGIKNNKPMGIAKIINESNKRLLNNEFEPMKIKVDYTQLKIDTKDYEDIFEIIKTSLDLAIHYFELLLSVKKATIEPVSSETYKDYCNIDNVDNDSINWFTNYDLILFPSFDKNPEDKKVYASASPCVMMVAGGAEKRPLAGRIYINNNYDYNKENIIVFLQTILFHEITHILVFDPYLLRIFGAIKTEIIDNETRFYIISPLALEKARLHFGCDNLKGIPLEDQGDEGSAGSHWEGRYMLGDYMVSTNYHENTISDITLALFEDSGWYKVNYYTGGLFRFGKNKGCEFFKKDCIIDQKATFSEFCHKSREPKCLASHLSHGECYIGDYKEESIPEKYQYFKKGSLGGLLNVNYCPTADSYFKSDYKNKYYFETNCRYGATLNLFSHYGEVIGNKSLCFESSLVPRYSPQPYKWRSICYKMTCDRANKNIMVYIDDLNVTCPYSGGILKKIDGFKGTINCPEYNMVCTSEIWCNEMFECIDRKSETDYSTYINYKSNN